MACVLVVEDAPDVREFMDLLLSSSGYETMNACDGADALAKMHDKRPCLVLLDMQMPVMDGWQFRRRQLEDPKLAEVPVICVTAVFDPAAVTRELGLRCLPKPIDFLDLLNEVQSACGGPSATR
jgi:CheY-like chemotaxis protein